MVKPIVTNMDDVKRPGKSAPSATSRPVLVSDGPTLPLDPMLASELESPAEGTAASQTPPLEHSTRAIGPLGEESPPPDAATDATVPDPASPASVLIAPELPENQDKAQDKDNAEPELPKTDAHKSPVSKVDLASKPPKSEPESKPETEPESESTPAASETSSSSTPSRDPEAAAAASDTAAQEAKTAREQELESIIASGKYTVPVNALQRKRSRMHVLLWSLVALMLAVALADVVFDVGLLHAPAAVPHTHFFTS